MMHEYANTIVKCHLFNLSYIYIYIYIFFLFFSFRGVIHTICDELRVTYVNSAS